MHPPPSVRLRQGVGAQVHLDISSPYLVVHCVPLITSSPRLGGFGGGGRKAERPGALDEAGRLCWSPLPVCFWRCMSFFERVSAWHLWDWRTFPGRHPCGGIAAIALGDKIKSPQPSFGATHPPSKEMGRLPSGTEAQKQKRNVLLAPPAWHDRGRLVFVTSPEYQTSLLSSRIHCQPGSYLSPPVPRFLSVCRLQANELEPEARETLQRGEKRKEKSPRIQRELCGSHFFKPAHSSATQATGVRAKAAFLEGVVAERNPPDRVGSVETHPFARF
ncbi:uncharacterized protein B0H64DRAFT_38485 [Chaetomium fimeti]|uniref:Uncharacterized protein n=1 Tax=Chaetomium fimeti TaxID=1854472 RepID=A0AAE0LXM2_9PEZI|nr:hypothetical protein B0H64DRAFT_38485 [Chaetomium fimeti]